MVLFGDELSGWGAAGIGSLASAVLFGVGMLAVRLYRARGGFAKDSADATVRVTESEAKIRRDKEDGDRKARRETEDAERQVRRDDEDSERKRESAILKEYKELVVEQREEIAGQRKLVEGLRDEMQTRDRRHSEQVQNVLRELAVCREGRARADERIASLEEALDNAKIPHRKWGPDGDGGSAGHQKLPGDGA